VKVEELEGDVVTCMNSIEYMDEQIGPDDKQKKPHEAALSYNG
jgi:hypothetical protein